MDVVGRYRVERRIGSGSFSTVWLAHDDALDVRVAIKVLSDNWIGNEDVRGRFIDEARLLRRIVDRRIISVHDIGQLPDGRDYFVMDYAPVGTVADLCRERLPPRTALQLGAELARAVAALHAAGILHRDIKPANLLLAGTPDRPHVVLADLGTSKRLAESSGLTMTAGTPAFMAPEQARGEPLDVRCDVYGIAAVCYRMLTGEVPFPDEDLTAVALRPPDRRPPALPPAAGPDANALLQRALSSDRDDRPPTAAAMAELLQRLADDPSADDSTELIARDPDHEATVDQVRTQGTVRREIRTPTAVAAAFPAESAVAVSPTGRGPTGGQLVGAGLLTVVVGVLVWLALSLLIGG